MLNSNTHYVIIGNGTAAIGVIEGIREVDRTGPITVISSEPYPVYGRPLISYMLLGKTTEEKMLQYRPADFYETHGVRLMAGRTVAAIDAPAKALTLDGGETVSYGKLCFCTGSRPFVPPMEGLDTVEDKTSFMTLDDAKRLSSLLGEDGTRDVLIVGAGLIGLKCAEGIIERAKSITVVDLAPRILPNVLDEHGSALIQKHIESQGVKFYLNNSITKFGPHRATLKTGETLAFDVLVVAVGVRPNTELAADAGCEVNRGILVDNCCRTNVPGLFAAGDCTVSHDISADTDRILAILPNAYLQGETAGIAMGGGNRPFDKAIPMNASGFMGLHMITAGSYDGETYTEDWEDGGYKKLVWKDDRLRGFILIGNVDRAGIYTSLIREKTPLSSIDFDLIKDRPQLMAFSKADRAKKLGGAR
ncbi:MAG: NAD(P)/FAD-dependent oxidoreductase [Intestinibacillus sp.]